MITPASREPYGAAAAGMSSSYPHTNTTRPSAPSASFRSAIGLLDEPSITFESPISTQRPRPSCSSRAVSPAASVVLPAPRVVDATIRVGMMISESLLGVVVDLAESGERTHGNLTAAMGLQPRQLIRSGRLLPVTASNRAQPNGIAGWGRLAALLPASLRLKSMPR